MWFVERDRDGAVESNVDEEKMREGQRERGERGVMWKWRRLSRNRGKKMTETECRFSLVLSNCSLKENQSDPIHIH